MHPAHATIGVSRPLSFFRPTQRELPSALSNSEAMSVRLVAGEIDGQIASVLLAFQRLLQGRFRVDCRFSFVDVAEGVSELDGIEASDCTVLYYQGITVLQDRSDWNPDLLGDGCFHASNRSLAEIAVVPADRGHPVLQGVGPFASRSGLPARPHGADDGVDLLLGHAGATSLPVAWAKATPGHRQFHTTLGSADDFRHPSYCRMLANAVAWVGGCEDGDCASDD
jgi:hypothetical protein